MERFSVTFVAILFFSVINVSSKFVYIDKKLYEGSECIGHDGKAGVCSFHCAALSNDEFKNVEAMCGFEKQQVMICCPTNATTKSSDLAIGGVSTTSIIGNSTIEVQDGLLSSTSQPTTEGVIQSTSTTSRPLLKKDKEIGTSLTEYPILKEACAYRKSKQLLRNDYINKIKRSFEEENQWRFELAELHRNLLLKDEENWIENCRTEGSAIGGDKGMQYGRWCETLRIKAGISERAPELKFETYGHSHMAVLGWTQTNDIVSWSCGATLIHENFVLTAAHCISMVGAPPDTVRIADSNLLRSKGDKFAINYDIEQIISHELYDSVTYYNDIALIRMKMQPRFREKLPPLPICIWTEKDYPTDSFTTLGYGVSALGQQFVSALKVNNFTLENNAECAIFYESGKELPEGIKDHQLCTSYPEEFTDACASDSGGPLQFSLAEKFDTPYLVGITSFGRQCLSENPGVYTKVYDFLDWIERKLREMIQKD